MPTGEPHPVLDDETEALIAQMVADSFDYFANRTSSNTWDPELGPSQIGASYHDYEEPLSSYERQILEDPDAGVTNEGWTVPDVRICLLLCQLPYQSAKFRIHDLIALRVLNPWTRMRPAY